MGSRQGATLGWNRPLVSKTVLFSGHKIVGQTLLMVLYLGSSHPYGYFLPTRAAVWLRFFSAMLLSWQIAMVKLKQCTWKLSRMQGIFMSVLDSKELKETMWL